MSKGPESGGRRDDVTLVGVGGGGTRGVFDQNTLYAILKE